MNRLCVIFLKYQFTQIPTMPNGHNNNWDRCSEFSWCKEIEKNQKMKQTAVICLRNGSI